MARPISRGVLSFGLVAIPVELKELIPIKKVDPVYFESTYYLAPDQAGEKGDPPKS